MPDLFDHAMNERMRSEAPLAARMRPRNLDEYIGQEHIVGPGKLLRRAIETDRLFSSIILWGPPGTGKTTLAQVIANQTQSHFETLSAILAGKSDLREVIDRAQERNRLYKQRTVLFIDEIHTLVGAGKSEGAMDAANILKPALARGELRAIGATTLDEYQKYFEKDKALERRFQVVMVDEPDRADSISILRGIRDSDSRTGSICETMAPRFGSNSTRPSVASTLKASRSGVRDRPSWAVSRRSFSRVPAASRPWTIRSRRRSVASS